MRDIPISFTIPYSDFVLGTLLLVFAVVAYLAISNHRERLKPFIAFMRSPSKYALPLVFLVLIPLALIAVYKIFGLIVDPNAWASDKRGLAVLLATVTGAPFVIWRTWIAQKQSYTAEQGHMTDRITKAVEQLGAEKTVKAHLTNSKGTKFFENNEDGDPEYKKPITIELSEPNLEVRLGAIYALERIAQDSQRDHAAIVDILCAYIRLNAPKSDGYIPEPFKSHKEINQNLLLKPPFLQNEQTERKSKYDRETRRDIEALASPRIDIQAAINSISHRYFADPSKSDYIAIVLDLSNCNLQNSVLIGNFNNTNFSNSLLDGAILQGNFNNCKLMNISRLFIKAGGAELATIQNTQNPPPKY